jgi:hypothetical protein
MILHEQEVNSVIAALVAYQPRIVITQPCMIQHEPKGTNTHI